ncbi:MAG TPA: PhoPQ-activated pathogenicity-related family protein [Candidatus Angelobacter sp.]|nr:PhoPQ-activated pathogenicity-related family protein [Candidatus Angelobacter sp.]
MKSRPLRFTFALSVATFACIAGLAAATADRTLLSPQTALDRYVATPDTNYMWRMVNTLKGDGYTTYVLDMTSQAWLTTNEVDRTLWQHWLTIVKPDQVTSSTGLLFISGGSNKSGAPSKADANFTTIATKTGTVTAELRNVPNEPLTFAGETQERTEDGIIAYTWDKFLRTGDEKWPARLPMTKAAVRAMDTITAFCASDVGGKVAVDKFFVSGGSKRGWTTWTTAAVDNRVIAIAPIVIDLLNIEPSFVHHWEAYGFWAPAIADYVALKIMDWSGTPEYRALMKIEEPYQYRARLGIPKFLINASGDQFFLPDSSQFYFNDLPGVKYLRYVPNADHGLKGSDAWQSLLACYNAVVKGGSLPEFSWTAGKDGSITVRSATRPAEATLWQATNEEARDFRLMTIGPAWKSTRIRAKGTGPFVYPARIGKPAKGWTAGFVELTFTNGTSAPFKFTTDVHVVPDVLPFKYTKPVPPR